MISGGSWTVSQKMIDIANNYCDDPVRILFPFVTAHSPRARIAQLTDGLQSFPYPITEELAVIKA